MKRACVVLFTKPAVAGRVKTRLCPPLEPDQAARLHAAFVGDLVEELMLGPFDLRIAWALETGEEPDLDLLPRAARDPARVPADRQVGSDLGERMFLALQRASAVYDMVAAVGSDHPGLSWNRVDQAFQKIGASTAEVVLGPASDGGYYLIAVAAPALDRRLFEDIEWSTSGVLAATLERCHELSRPVAQLAVGDDVDTGEDLELLYRRLELGQVEAGPRLATLLKDWNLKDRDLKDWERLSTRRSDVTSSSGGTS